MQSRRSLVTEAMPRVARGAQRMLIESAVIGGIAFAAYAASRPPVVATLGRLYDDVVYL